MDIEVGFGDIFERCAEVTNVVVARVGEVCKGSGRERLTCSICEDHLDGSDVFVGRPRFVLRSALDQPLHVLDRDQDD
jgi:hypothetical protein